MRLESPTRDFARRRPPATFSFTVKRFAPLLVVFVTAASALLAPAGVQADSLPEPVQRVLDKAGVPHDSISAFVQDVTQNIPLVEFKADTSRNPASVMKLFGTAVALHELGPGYKWQTHAYADGSLKGDRLEGNLVLKGYGDPLLITEYFWRFLRHLRDRGLRHITGDLVIDESFFSIIPQDRGAFDGRPYHAYNVLPAALLVNFHAYEFKLRPDKSRKKIVITADPPSTTIEIQNRLKFTNGRCRGKKFRIRAQVLEGLPDSAVRFSGTYPSACGSYAVLRTVSTQAPYIYGVFSALWKELGGQIDGGVKFGTVPESSRKLFAFSSPTLADVIRPMNKFSNNVMSRNLLLTLGAERLGEPGTVAKGRKAVRDWLQKAGIDTQSLVIDNGAGLSRAARTSARLMGEMLLHVYHSPYMPEFVASLPLAAIDGTMKKRFRDKPLGGRMHIKTGLIDHVRAMGGYMLNRNGRTFVVVLLQNYPNIHWGMGTRAQDALLEWVFDR
jgi:D-alanyl-D-alanine carboxypeptidase/D-alanyl-D-alanine-endopeptidase (penicillin-binding protein 4)